MDARKEGRTDNVKTVYPPQTKFAGGIIMCQCDTDDPIWWPMHVRKCLPEGKPYFVQDETNILG